MFKAVVGTISTNEQVAQILGELKAAGFATTEISVLFPQGHDTAGVAPELAIQVPEGAAIGAASVGAAGMWLGGGIGLLAGLGAIAIPGIGAFLVAGPLLSMLSGAAVGATVGATVGTLTGVLVTLGVPELQAQHYEGRVTSGRILMSVHGEDRAKQSLAAAILERLGAEDIYATEESAAPIPAPARRAAHSTP